MFSQWIFLLLYFSCCCKLIYCKISTVYNLAYTCSALALASSHQNMFSPRKLEPSSKQSDIFNYQFFWKVVHVSVISSYSCRVYPSTLRPTVPRLYLHCAPCSPFILTVLSRGGGCADVFVTYIIEAIHMFCFTKAYWLLPIHVPLLIW